MRKEQRRQLLLHSAREVFAQQGYHGASVDDIIGRAGVARGTFYLYFTSKHAVFKELVEGLLAGLSDAIRRVAVEPGAAGIFEQLRGNAQRVFEVLAREPGMTRILLHEAVGRDLGFDAQLSEFYDKVLTLIAESIDLGQQMGLVRQLDRGAVSRFVLGSFKEVLYDGRFCTDLAALPHIAAELVRFVFSGIAA